jgi:hypothetical protein
MTKEQEDIIRMAQEAGWNDGGDYINIEQFAALVAKKYIEKIKDLEDFITELQERT